MTLPGVEALRLRAPARGGLAASSLGLLVAKGLQMGGGFLFWVVAARNASVGTVGIAVACISGVMLCTQLGVLGTGSAVIIALGEGEEPAGVLDTAVTVLTVASVLAGSGYLLLTAVTGDGALGPVEDPRFFLIFVATAVLGTLVICIDQASIALHHAGGAATRYGLGAMVALVTALAVLPVVDDADALLLLACWATGVVTAAVVGLVQLRAWAGYRYRPAVRLQQVSRVLVVGVPNQLLTATERLSPVLIPIVLAHVASPTTTAYWYPAWMMAWVAFNAPISVGMVQFKDVVAHPERAAAVVRHGLVLALALGGGVALVAAAGAEPLLQLLGDEYAESSATALRILLVGLLPFAVLQAYNALCRGLARTREAIVLGMAFMTVVSFGTAFAGARGPTAVAVTWVLTSTAAGAVALVRTRVLLRRLHAGQGAR